MNIRIRTEAHFYQKVQFHCILKTIGPQLVEYIL